MYLVVSYLEENILINLHNLCKYTRLDHQQTTKKNVSYALNVSLFAAKEMMIETIFNYSIYFYVCIG